MKHLQFLLTGSGQTGSIRNYGNWRWRGGEREHIGVICDGVVERENGLRQRSRKIVMGDNERSPELQHTERGVAGIFY